MGRLDLEKLFDFLIIVWAERVVMVRVGEREKLFGRVGRLEQFSAQLDRHNGIGLSMALEEGALVLADQAEGV